jgi:AmiR/NasT family two-component response regulator
MLPAVEEDETVAQLRTGMEHRTTIGVALGIFMERYDLSQDAAFDALRRESQTRNLKLYALAVQLAATRQLPGS